MQIPALPPDISLPTQSRRDLQALSPITAVPGIPESAENLNPAIALQWTQPVLTSQASQSLRSHLETLTNAKAGVTTTEQAPSTLLQAVALSPIGALLQKLLIASAKTSESIPWPNDQKQFPSENMSVTRAMASLYKALESSDAFSASHLVNHFFGRSTDSDSMEHTESTIQQWFAGLDPESSAAKTTAQMLTKGEMIWQGQLLPHLPVEIKREDAWRETASGDGSLEKGVCLKLEVQLPQMGKLRIIAHQWGDDMTLTLQENMASTEAFDKDWNTLVTRLTSTAMARVRIQRMPLNE